MTTEITINGEAEIIDLSESVSVAELLEQRGYQAKRIAVAINQAFVPRNAYAETFIAEGDDIEIVAPISGG